MASSAHAKTITPVRWPRSRLLGALCLIGAVAGLNGAVACTPTGSDEFPPGVQDPAVIKTPDGAVGFYHSVVTGLGPMVEPIVTYVGIMTDELTDLPLPVGVSVPYTLLDSRRLTKTSLGAGEVVGTIGTKTGAGAPEIYAPLHRLRGQAREARGFLTTYAPDSTALVGELYALEGYAVVLLADLYCSGVPLSTVDFGADYTMAAGSTTEELYTHAKALFDTALTSASGNDRVQELAAVGRGRALVALGQYAEAATAVGMVPTAFRYEIVAPLASNATRSMLANFSFTGDNFHAVTQGLPSMGDQEGGNGLDFRSSGDPRTPAAVLNATPDPFGHTIYFPAKYPAEGPTTYVLADGLEARLIEAEAALAVHSDDGQWLTMLNALRTDGTFDTQPNADDPSQTDTLWHAGSGGVPGLRPLVDPGGAEARVRLLFRERAFWLYLTAHRQGDLRRLVRQYHLPRTTVFPTGFYAGGNGQYGDDVTLPIPDDEQHFNPNSTGCFNRSA